MSDALSIGLSGLTAATTRLAARASNIANATSDGSVAASAAAASGAAASGATTPPSDAVAYRAVSANIVATAGGGTRTLIAPTSPAFIQEYQPDSAFADAKGLVAAPNVDLGAEITGQIQDGAYAKANAAVIRAADDLLRKAIDLKS